MPKYLTLRAEVENWQSVVDYDKEIAAAARAQARLIADRQAWSKEHRTWGSNAWKREREVWAEKERLAARRVDELKAQRERVVLEKCRELKRERLQQRRKTHRSDEWKAARRAFVRKRGIYDEAIELQEAVKEFAAERSTIRARERLADNLAARKRGGDFADYWQHKTRMGNQGMRAVPRFWVERDDDLEPGGLERFGKHRYRDGKRYSREWLDWAKREVRWLTAILRVPEYSSAGRARVSRRLKRVSEQIPAVEEYCRRMGT